jgi:hypothetical protein
MLIKGVWDVRGEPESKDERGYQREERDCR